MIQNPAPKSSHPPQVQKGVERGVDGCQHSVADEHEVPHEEGTLSGTSLQRLHPDKENIVQ